MSKNREDPSHEADINVDANSEIRARLMASKKNLSIYLMASLS